MTEEQEEQVQSVALLTFGRRQFSLSCSFSDCLFEVTFITYRNATYHARSLLTAVVLETVGMTTGH